MELAAELLEITSEEELDQFLGKLLKGAWRGIKKVGSAVGKIARPLGSALKGVAKVALPIAGKVAGGFFGGPIGGAIGGKLGSLVSKALEMEFEGLSGEEREFEMAQRFVRVAGTAARKAAIAPPGRDPQDAVKGAVVEAARRHLPHFSRLAVSPASPSTPGSPAAGQVDSSRPQHHSVWSLNRGPGRAFGSPRPRRCHPSRATRGPGMTGPWPKDRFPSPRRRNAFSPTRKGMSSTITSAFPPSIRLCACRRRIPRPGGTPSGCWRK